ncbi:short-chain dehydrogenase/reductase [Lasiosphaeria hispida]|uniref:Short-chain dehydrogenase/reductase n=1 Tax=Lasiosphaeria hispida TaxID=260671 RepID=A0AAJ0H9Y4_9PEZI|nr:short-chain dehydrogenase/reductase [Lasiosphaeria hispida]
MASVFHPGNTAVITGGASGIGLALTKRCVRHGMKVLVADWDAELLGQVGGGSGEVSTMQMDVSKREDWAGLQSRVEDEFDGKVNLLALNAGVGLMSDWSDLQSFQQILDVNLYGVINGINTLLPTVKSTATASPAAIVITGSKQGITNPPGNPAYNASKAAVKALAEHLSFDLRNVPNIGVHLLVPGWTFTGLSGNRPGGGRAKPDGAWWPEQVVDYLEARMAEGRFYILCPDNDVSEETDKKRMQWAVGDLVESRPPLTRWREDWKTKAQEWIDSQPA